MEWGEGDSTTFHSGIQMESVILLLLAGGCFWRDPLVIDRYHVALNVESTSIKWKIVVASV